MHVINRTHQNHSYYTNVYDKSYITDHLCAGSETRLRLTSQWWAAKAAVGIDPYQPIPFPGVTFKSQISFQDQIHVLKNFGTRAANTVMEIGSGAGELSAVFAGLGSTVYSIDSNPHVEPYHAQYLRNLNAATDQYHLWLGSAGLFTDTLPHSLDTVILVESLEHFIPSEWDEFWLALKPILVRNHARLIIANPVWPIAHNGWDHILPMDDAWFDHLLEGQTAQHRQQGYLCVQY